MKEMKVFIDSEEFKGIGKMPELSEQMKQNLDVLNNSLAMTGCTVATASAALSLGLSVATDIVDEMAENLNRCMAALMASEEVQKLSELAQTLNEVEQRPLPPVTLKKMIKREKNPLRKKQLQRELNESYKRWNQPLSKTRENERKTE